MKIVYLPSARDDRVWMRSYYTRVFPEGSARARAHFRSAQHMLAANPEVGRPSDIATVRELQVARTPFSIFIDSTEAALKFSGFGMAGRSGAPSKPNEPRSSASVAGRPLT